MSAIGGRRKKEFGRPCPYCGQPMQHGRHAPSPDHLHPRSRGGGAGRNIVYVGLSCNRDKGGLSILEFWGKLDAAKDRRAHYVAKFIAELPTHFHIGWASYLGTGSDPNGPESVPHPQQPVG